MPAGTVSPIDPCLDQLARWTTTVADDAHLPAEHENAGHRSGIQQLRNPVQVTRSGCSAVPRLHSGQTSFDVDSIPIRLPTGLSMAPG